MNRSAGAEVWAAIAKALATGAAVWLEDSVPSVRARQMAGPEVEVIRLRSPAQVSFARALLGSRKKPG